MEKRHGEQSATSNGSSSANKGQNQTDTVLSRDEWQCIVSCRWQATDFSSETLHVWRQSIKAAMNCQLEVGILSALYEQQTVGVQKLDILFDKTGFWAELCTKDHGDSAQIHSEKGE